MLPYLVALVWCVCVCFILFFAFWTGGTPRALPVLRLCFCPSNPLSMAPPPLSQLNQDGIVQHDTPEQHMLYELEQTIVLGLRLLLEGFINEESALRPEVE